MAVRLTNFSYRGKSIVRDTFIETGTYLGESLQNARRAGFKTLHSVEVYEPNHRAARQEFADAPNVHLHLGSSPVVLPQIINPAVATTFWLDAHFQGVAAQERDPTYGECPLLHELTMIFSCQWTVSPIVLIDDAYMFDARIRPGFDRAQWPSVKQIRDALPSDYAVTEFNEILYCLHH